MQDKIIELEAQLNEWSVKADLAEDAGLNIEKNMDTWKHYWNRYMGFIRALRMLGYEVDWDADNNRFTVNEGK